MEKKDYIANPTWWDKDLLLLISNDYIEKVNLKKVNH